MVSNQNLENYSVTVWHDGTWKLWQKRDAEYAQNDKNWLLTIDGSELTEILKTELSNGALQLDDSGLS